ncbi:3-keto-disaccharide hydrolase [Flagellimonas eckloniae]|uniref:3-keto-disaccharide hydrolase n=1 Tax=Flagellimonas eckloniae TaxID=346185 RepID=UPI001585B751|nr:DUF1080 domain-containing protein [Allomuricauda eckloniae]
MKLLLFTCIGCCFMISQLSFSQNTNEVIEPEVAGNRVIDLLEGGTLDAWKVPSTNWKIQNESIIGSTGEEKLEIPEWLYTKQRFRDFEFTCEMRLSGDRRRNTGIYYRVHPFLFKSQNGKKSYMAPSGYEFDAAFHHPDGKNFRGTLGDWYARPSLRIFPDKDIINKAYKTDEWNRMTLRAHGNRLEYWINGFKVMDYTDTDPKASQEGIIGFQIHDGSVMTVEYRNIRVLPL